MQSEYRQLDNAERTYHAILIRQFGLEQSDRVWPAINSFAWPKFINSFGNRLVLQHREFLEEIKSTKYPKRSKCR